MTLRVASVPATHVYARSLAHPEVERLADPTGDDLRTPSFFDTSWWRANGRHIDLLHVHFGFEFYGPDELEAVCDELDRQDIPVVYTCHDLRNPNHMRSAVQDAALDIWMRRATQIVTLTPWAAARIDERFGRTATVLPHPHVVPLEELRRRQAVPRPAHWDRYRIGIHFKSLRQNMFGAQILTAALDAIAPHGGVRLRVDLHCDVMDPRADVHDPELAYLVWRTVANATSPIDLHFHHYVSDDELWQLITSVDAFLLPYRFGTHSGLLEACRDLGTAVIAPSAGAYRDQGADHVFDVSDDGELDVPSLHRAVAEAVAMGRPAPVSAEDRAAERERVADAHVALYREALDACVRSRGPA